MSFLFVYLFFPQQPDPVLRRAGSCPPQTPDPVSKMSADAPNFTIIILIRKQLNCYVELPSMFIFTIFQQGKYHLCLIFPFFSIVTRKGCFSLLPTNCRIEKW